MAKANRAIIYIPGLGDRKSWLVWLQRQALLGWRAFGIRGYVFTMKWTSDSSIEPRFRELSSYIDRLKEQGYEVSLMGASAGASAAVNMFAQRPDDIEAAISVCGQLRGADKVVNQALDLNPRFEESLKIMNKNLKKLSGDERQRILTLRTLIDAVVPPSHSTLKGANNQRLWVFGHLFGIGWVLVARAERVSRFIKKAKG